MLHTLLLIIQLFCAIGIIALVLLQRGKGADAGAGFGSGASGTVFGARGATTALSRATAILAAVFMLTSLSLAYLGTHAAATSSSSLLDQLSKPAAPSTSTPAPHAVVPVAPVAPPAGGGAAPASGGAAPTAPGATGAAPTPPSGGGGASGAGGAH